MRAESRFRTWQAEFFDELGLTLGGRIAFAVVFAVIAVFGISGVVAQLALNPEGQGDHLAAVSLIFLGIGLLLALWIVVGVDAAFRFARTLLRRHDPGDQRQGQKQ